MLRRGELVAFPTETVYGLGAHALDPDAVARIYAAKGRPAWNPVIVHVPDVEAAAELTAHWPARAERLAAAFWPGPLTLVLPKRAHVPDIVTAGSGTVAVRVPAHRAALALLREAGLPVAAPSANRFTALSPTTARHVAEGLGDRVSLILDGGPCDVGIESTVVDLTGDTVAILRPGQLGETELAEALSEPVTTYQRDIKAPEEENGTPHRSPGMSVRHYAPRAEVWLAEADDRAEVRAAAAGATGMVGVLALDGGLDIPAAGRTERLPRDPAGYARGLYAALHTLDDAGCAVIVVELPPDEPAWAAVRDRLRRATR